VQTWSGDATSFLELRPGDGFYCPQGTPHQYYNIGSSTAKAVLGVAPRWAA
jgi:uncharacterized RmlC-like cupin family protein